MLSGRKMPLRCINEKANVRQNLQSSSKINDYGNNIMQANHLNMCLQIITLPFKVLEDILCPVGRTCSSNRLSPGFWPEPLSNFSLELDPLWDLKLQKLFKVLASKSLVSIKRFPRDTRNRGKIVPVETLTVILRKHHRKQTSSHLNTARVVYFHFPLWSSTPLLAISPKSCQQR